MPTNIWEPPKKRRGIAGARDKASRPKTPYWPGVDGAPSQLEEVKEEEEIEKPLVKHKPRKRKRPKQQWQDLIGDALPEDLKGKEVPPEEKDSSSRNPPAVSVPNEMNVCTTTTEEKEDSEETLPSQVSPVAAAAAGTSDPKEAPAVEEPMSTSDLRHMKYTLLPQLQSVTNSMVQFWNSYAASKSNEQNDDKDDLSMKVSQLEEQLEASQQRYFDLETTFKEKQRQWTNEKNQLEENLQQSTNSHNTTLTHWQNKFQTLQNQLTTDLRHEREERSKLVSSLLSWKAKAQKAQDARAHMQSRLQAATDLAEAQMHAKEAYQVRLQEALDQNGRWKRKKKK